MAFRRLTHDNRKIQMVSLIDLIFILLIFFIISSIMIKLTKGESQLFVPTPKDEPGEAQVLIQIVDENQYLWIDHTAIDTLNLHTYKLGSPVSTDYKVSLLMEKMSLDAEGLSDRLGVLVEETERTPNKDYFILIRCPDSSPYYYATNIIEELVDSPSFDYGLVAGSLEDLRQKGTILVEGNVINIDF